MARQRHAGRPEAVLKHDPQRDPGGAARGDQFPCAGRGDLDRLLQQHVLSGRCTAAGNVEMRVGRRQDENGLHRSVVENPVQAVAQRKGKALAELGSPALARAEGMDDLDLVGEVEEAARMRRHRHAETDERDTRLRHVRPVNVRVGSNGGHQGPNHFTGSKVSAGT